MYENPLHEVAKSRLPHDNVSLKPGVNWVAILYPEKSNRPIAELSKSQDSFLFLKVPSTFPISRLLKAYEDKFQEKVTLLHDGRRTDLDAPLSDYNFRGETLLTFEAHTDESLRIRQAREEEEDARCVHESAHLIPPDHSNPQASTDSFSRPSPVSTHSLPPMSLNDYSNTSSNTEYRAATVFSQRRQEYQGPQNHQLPVMKQETSSCITEPVSIKSELPSGDNNASYGDVPNLIGPGLTEGLSEGSDKEEGFGSGLTDGLKEGVDDGYSSSDDNLTERSINDSPERTSMETHVKPEEPLIYSWRDNIREKTPEESQQSQVSNIDDTEMPSQEYLQQLTTDTVPERLERGVRMAGKLLDSLASIIGSQEQQNGDSQHWQARIKDLKAEQQRRPRTVVGVVGNTGAGKSSVINAMLDEERLVPTNCMRACTAVVTELSYNDSPEQHLKYRAEIEFIKPEDWKKELDVLASDLIDANGEVSRESTQQDSDAGIAYAKIKAVYPRLTKEDMVAALKNTQRMLDHSSVKKVLGTTTYLRDRYCDSFYKKLQGYVDSKEKSTGKEKEKDKNKTKEPRPMEYWPLIKVVKIYVKASALETGAVIVDLPGVHDSNAARAAVAQGYMKQCTGLWIVAPITRAVDDKAAKTLLGDTFKRQLKYDGTYSAVTFICSKTDDISITEATDSLGLEEEVSTLQDRLDDANRQIKSLEKQIDEVAEAKHIFQSKIDAHEEKLEQWDEIQDKFEDGKPVYAPRSPKRKRMSSSVPKKKRKVDDDDSDFDGNADNSDSTDETEDEAEDSENRAALTEDEIDDMIDSLKKQKKSFRREKSSLDDRLKELRQEVKAIRANKLDIQGEMNIICIAGRNEYSKGAIQQDFAAGIRELDQENAVEQDELNFNPEEELRDYQAVAESLPVFCVSSRAYQRLCGRLQKDASIPGFSDVEETEIPQLQTHCRKLTEAGRASACRLFLNKVTQLLNSLALWAANDGSGPPLTDTQQAAEYVFLKRALVNLEKGLDKAVSSGSREMKNTLAEHIYEKYDEAIQQAEINAGPTSTVWGDSKHPRGLRWATYKATVKRDGVYCGARGPKDFNQELTEPMIKSLATGWERAFQRRLPHVLAEYAKSSKRLLRDFHTVVEARARERGVGIAGMHMLSGQIATYEQSFNDLMVACVATMTEHQKEASRVFSPVIAEAMKQAYIICTEERGTGSYMRMKLAMSNHVEAQRSRMFNQAAENVKSRLDEMCKAVKTKCNEMSDTIFLAVERDYKQIFGGVKLPENESMSKAERTFKRECKALLWTADGYFKPVVLNEALTAEEIDEVLAEQTKDEEVVETKEHQDEDTVMSFEPPSPAKYREKTEEVDIKPRTIEDSEAETRRSSKPAFGTPRSVNSIPSGFSSQSVTSPAKNVRRNTPLNLSFASIDQENMEY